MDNLRGLMVGVDGVPDGPAFVVADYPGAVMQPALGSDADGLLAVWAEELGLVSDLIGRRIRSDGTLPDEAPFIIATAAAEQACVHLAASQQVSFAEWAEGADPRRKPRFARFDATGVPLDPEGVSLQEDRVQSSCTTSAASDGAGFLHVWMAYGNDTDVRGTRIGSDGAVLDHNGFVISAADRDQLNPVVAWNGTEYLVAWHDTRDGSLRARRVTAEGRVLDHGGILVEAGSAGSIRLASNGSTFLVAWQLDLIGPDRILGAIVDARGRVRRSGISIDQGLGDNSSPAVASDGQGYVVSWLDSSGSHDQIHGVRLDGRGTVLDPAGIAISSGGGMLGSPAVAWDGSAWLVAWGAAPASGGYRIFGAHVLADGTVQDDQTTLVASKYGPLAPALATGPQGGVVLGYVRLSAQPAHGWVDRAFIRLVPAL